jgi:hypothetical protein
MEVLWQFVQPEEILSDDFVLEHAFEAKGNRNPDGQPMKEREFPRAGLRVHFVILHHEFVRLCAHRFDEQLTFVRSELRYINKSPRLDYGCAYAFQNARTPECMQVFKVCQ